MCPTCGHRLADSGAAEESRDSFRDSFRDPFVGRRLGRFRVLEPLGRGRVGAVYRALDPRLGREVALKVLHPEACPTPRDEIRFLREARILAGLQHSAIGTLHEVDTDGDRPFLVLALHEGETLETRLARGPLSNTEVLSIARSLAGALTAAHRGGVVHRDLKPSNVILTEQGARLVDFGLARLDDASGLTGEGLAPGSLSYLAPEQVRGKRVDHRADLWAFGVLIHEMVTGHRPFGGTSIPGAARSILEDDPPPLRRPGGKRPPAPLGRWVARCLEKDPERRSAGAHEVLTELDRPYRRRSFVHLALVAISLLAVVLAGGWLSRAPSPRAEGPVPSVIYVAAPEPVVETTHPSETRWIAANLQVAVMRGLLALPGLAPVDPTELREASGPARELARQVAADEVITTRAGCRDGLCQVTLQRLSGLDGRLLWNGTLQVAMEPERLLAEAVAADLLEAYPDLSPQTEDLELRIEDADYRAYLEIGSELSKGGAPDAEMLDRLTGLAGRAPHLPEVHLTAARVARYLFELTRDLRYLEQGRRFADTAAGSSPDDSRAEVARVELDLAAGDLVSVRTRLERLALHLEARAEAHRLEARLWELSGEGERAVEAMRAAVALRPSTRNLLTFANLETRLGHLDGARRHLERLLERAPGHRQGMQTLAQVDLLAGRAGRAVDLLRTLVEEAPDVSNLTNLGTGLLLLGRLDEALAALRRAHRQSPDHPQVLLALADALDLQGRPGEAALLYRRVVEHIDANQEGQPWYVLSVKAQALAHLGEHPRAVGILQTALDRAPDQSQLAFEAALVYTLAGERYSALHQAHRALEGGLDRRWLELTWFDRWRGDPGWRALKSGTVRDPD